MPRLLPLALVVVITNSGCAAIYRAAAGEEDPDITSARDAAIKLTGCRSEMKVSDRDWSHNMKWQVTGCGRTVACQDTHAGYVCFNDPPRLVDFQEQHIPEGFESVAIGVAELTGCPFMEAGLTTPDDRTPAVVSAKICGRTFVCTRSWRDRVRPDCTETFLSKEATSGQMVIDRLSLETGCEAALIELDSRAAWTNGSERAYRLKACGHRYVCTVATGRTDCKAALDDVAGPATSDAGVQEKQAEPKGDEPKVDAPRRPLR